MADTRTMAEMLHAPTERNAEATVVPPILAEQFELKHSLINMMTSEQFFGLEKDNPPDHIRCLRNEISNFGQKFDESFLEAWDRYKDLLRACPHYGFTELHQLNTFYNALNPTDQDSLNAAAGGNLLERSTQDVLTIIENKSKVRNSRSKSIASQVKACDTNSNSEIAKLTHAVNEQTSAMTTAMTAMLKQFQAIPPPAPVKAVEETCVTCGAAVNYNQGNPGYRPQGVANQIRPPAQQNQNFHLNGLEKIKRMNEVSMKAMQNQIDMVKNDLRNEIKTSIQTSLSNQTNEIKNIMASLLQMNIASSSSSGTLPSNKVANPKSNLKAITTQSGVSYDGPSIPPPVVENTPEATKDTVIPTNNGNIEDVQPQAVPSKSPVSTSEPANTPTRRALIDVFEGELTLRVGKEAITFNMDQTSRYSANYNDMTAKRIDVIDMACEEYSQEVLGFSDTVSNGNPTPFYDPIISATSLTLTPFRDSDFFLEELSEVRKELKIYEAKTKKSSVDEPPVVKLKALPSDLEYAFLEGDDKLPVIIAKDLSVEEKAALITVLKSHKRAIAWKLSVIKGENHASWSDKLDDALWAFRTAYKTPIGCTPYKLVYKKACHLPVKLEHKAYWALKHANFDLKTAGDHRKIQIIELNELRDQAYENSLIYNVGLNLVLILIIFLLLAFGVDAVEKIKEKH
nr:reverse transcriptase domain-containing protein [Tanacetum cinerariifolium]